MPHLLSFYRVFLFLVVFKKFRKLLLQKMREEY
jgi:hypothetical protein